MAKSKRKHLYSKGGHTYAGVSSLANNAFNSNLYQSIEPIEEDAIPSNRELRQMNRALRLNNENDGTNPSFLQQYESSFGPQAFATSAAAQQYGQWAASRAAQQYAKAMASNAAQNITVDTLGGNAGIYKSAYDTAVASGKTAEEAGQLASKAVSDSAAQTAGAWIGGLSTAAIGVKEAYDGLTKRPTDAGYDSVMEGIYGGNNVNTNWWGNIGDRRNKGVIKAINNTNFNSNALNGNSLITDFRNNATIYDTNEKAYKRGFGKTVGDFGKAIFTGARNGLTAGGPFGAIVGAAIGLGQQIGNTSTNKERRKATLNAMTQSNIRTMNRANNLSTGIQKYNVRHDLLNYGVPGYGTTGVYAAQGGKLNFSGTNFNTGLNYFGTGSSHEMNINGGIPQGIAPDGQPNLVEEGETKWEKENYIFSKRMKPRKGTMQEANLFKFGGKEKSYADLSIDINKEAEERPNDPISIATRDRLLSRLRDAQELDRIREQQEQMQQMQQMMSQLPPEQQYAMMQQMQSQVEPTQEMQVADPNQIAMEQQAMAQQQMPEEVPQNPYSYQDASGAIMAANGGNLNLNNAHTFAGEPTVEQVSKWTLQAKNRPTYGNNTSATPQPMTVHDIGFASTIDSVFSVRAQEIKNSNKSIAEKRKDAEALVKDWNDYNKMYAELAQMSKEDLKSDEGVKKVKAMQEKFQEMGLNAALADKAVQEQMNLITESQGSKAAKDQATDGIYGRRTDARYLDARREALINDFNSIGISINPWDNDQGAWFDALAFNTGVKYRTLNPEYAKAIQQGVPADQLPSQYIELTIPEGYTPEQAKEYLKGQGYNFDSDSQDLITDYYDFSKNPQQPQEQPEEAAPTDTFKPLPTWLRGVGAIAPFFFANNKSDYSNADMIKAPTIGFSPVRDYLTYNPLDRQMYLQQLNSQQANTLNNIRNTAGGNRAATLSAMANANSNYFTNFGKLLREAEEMDLAQRKEVAAQNGQINEFNSKGFFDADASNQKVLYDAALNRANMRHEVDKLTAAANGANLTMGLQNLYGIGTQNANYNMVNGNPAYVAYLDPRTGETKYKGSKSNGGRLLITKKSKRR